MCREYHISYKDRSVISARYTKFIKSTRICNWSLMNLKPLRVCYSIILIALLFIPFGVYHSRSEPYLIGSLWGYQLPIGYVGLLLGLFVILYSRMAFGKNLRFGSVMIGIGFLLILSFLFRRKTILSMCWMEQVLAVFKSTLIIQLEI